MGKAGRPRRGAAMRDLGVMPGCDVLVDRGKVAAVGRSLSMPPGVRVIDAGGRVLMPGFVDCHTHACWAGDRIEEWGRRLRGENYLDILRAGGGIMSTVRAVRGSEEGVLASGLLRRLNAMLVHGTTTAEVKSGYGLSSADELKMLRAIAGAGRVWAGTLAATALLGHAIDPDEPDFVERTIGETLPAVSGAFPGVAVDAYCERGAWSVADTVRLLGAAKVAGHPVRVHADQFSSLGMVGEAVRLGAVSADHLEASERGDLESLASSGVFGVLLPCCGLHLDGRYAKGRDLIDLGGLVAIATNYNPGSAPCPGMAMAVALAVRGCGLTPEEAITASTINAAAVLGLTDRGAIAPGQRADLLLLRHRDERELAFEFGGNPCDAVICGGEVVAGAVSAGVP